MADADVQGMLVRIEATTAQLRQEMARADTSVSQASTKIDKSLGRVDTAFDRAGSSAESAAGLIKTVLAAAVGAASIGKIVETADSYGQMSDRIGQATSSVGEYDLVQQRLLSTSKRTYRPLSEAQELYIRTADSLKSMGYNTEQALDVMDSFSFLLVTNSASAEKGAAAIDAYSKALQTGKIEADGWQSILAAMPTIVDTIAKSTGQTSEQIRSLGAQGKLSLDTLTTGLQKSAEANGLLADSMGVAVRDAIQNLSNAFSVYVGRLNETYDGTGLLASGISLLGDNFETLAEIAGVAAAAALAVYARNLGVSAAASVTATKASLETAIARRAEAATVLLAAQAEQQKAATALFLAEKELAASKTRISGMAVEREMALQVAEARMVEARATAAVTAAQSAMVSPARTVLGLLGGPVGIAMLAVGAATAFLTLRDNTSVLEQKLGDLADPLDKLTERFNKLNRATQSVTLRELRASIADTQKDLTAAAGSIAFELQASLSSAGLAGASGFMGGIAPLPAEFQKAMDIVNQAVKDSAAGQSVDWKTVADQVRLIPGVTEEMAQAIETGQIKVSDLTATLNKQKQALAELSGETDENTRAQLQNNAAKAQAETDGQKYLDQLQKQLGAAQDKTALQAANRFIAENTLLTEGMVVAIRSAAAAKDSQKAADDAAAAAARKTTSEAASAAKAQLKSFESAEEAYLRQISLIDQTTGKQKTVTEVSKLNFELQTGKLAGLNTQQQERLKGLASELDALGRLNKSAEDAIKIEQARIEILKETGQLKAANAAQSELDDAAKMLEYQRQGNTEAATQLENLKKIRDINLQAQLPPKTVEGVTQAPKAAGIDVSIGGPTSEIERLNKDAEDLEAWRAAELEKQQGYLDLKVINEQSYADRVANINKQARDNEAAISSAKNTAMLTGAADFFGNMAALSTSENKKLAAIGKASAIAEATIQGILGVQRALGAFPPPFNFIAAAGVGVAAAVNVAKIAGVGFEKGGYTGNFGRKQVVGAVHGQEYVMNAEATARIGVGTLEALSNGDISMLPSGGSDLAAAGGSSGGQGARWGGSTNVDRSVAVTQNIYTTGRVDNRTSNQMQRDAVRKQQTAIGRLG
jgi:tape measure domain-containing protein